MVSNVCTTAVLFALLCRASDAAASPVAGGPVDVWLGAGAAAVHRICDSCYVEIAHNMSPVAAILDLGV
jgi:hypothetical protein